MFKLSDDTIVLIARQLQVAILTGTDVVDNLRLLELEVKDGQLVPSVACLKSHDDQIDSLLTVLEKGQLMNGYDEGQIVS
jgi:hypothetical protein